jgi:cardiolipin synthase
MTNLEHSSFTGAILVTAEIAGFLCAIDAVMRPRSSQGAIAWFVALISMPFITVPLYLLFGRTRFHGYTEVIREKEALVGAEMTEWFSSMNFMAAPPKQDLEVLENVLRRLTSIPFTRGNQVELLLDGEETYRVMLEAIASAVSYIYVQFYIVRNDSTSRNLCEALIEKARTGVQVYFLYDEIGSIELPDSFFEPMRQASINISGFKTTKGWKNRFQINFRNHRKLLVVDGNIGFIGGHNLGDEYLNYRDTSMRIKGPAVQQIQLTFLKDWFWAMGETPLNNKSVIPSEKADQAVAIVSTGPSDTNNNCSVLFSTLINIARQRLWITSPYFVPDDVIVRALQAAALRGVDIRILLPRKADQKLVELASFTYYDDMTSCGVRLFRYRNRFMHQKVILIDERLAGIGTVNLDNRSLYLNFEATGLVADHGFAKRVETMLQEDLAWCKEVHCSHFDERPVWFRVAAKVARLASPLL